MAPHTRRRGRDTLAHARQREMPLVLWQLLIEILKNQLATTFTIKKKKKELTSEKTHQHVWRDSSTCVAWLIHMCDVTNPQVWRDTSTGVTWLIHMCDVTHPYVWRDSSTCVTWLIHMCDVTHPHVWHDSFIYTARARQRAVQLFVLQLLIEILKSQLATTFTAKKVNKTDFWEMSPVYCRCVAGRSSKSQKKFSKVHALVHYDGKGQ